MAIHSSILAWRIPWTKEHGGLQSMGSQSQTRMKQQQLSNNNNSDLGGAYKEWKPQQKCDESFQWRDWTDTLQASQSAPRWPGLSSAPAPSCQGEESSAVGTPSLKQRASLVEAPGLWNRGSADVAHGLSCSAACGIFLDQGSNSCFLHWQADSLPLNYQGNPCPRLISQHLRKYQGVQSLGRWFQTS